jgi:hypothetical protein
MDTVVRAKGGFLAPSLSVDEDVDVLPDCRALVEDPAGNCGMLVLEGAQDLAYGRAVHIELSLAARELGERSAKPHYSHGPILVTSSR